MPNFKTGDVFRLQLSDDQAVSGRVMLDIYRQCVQPRRIDSQSPLAFFNKALLVEIYRQDTPFPVRDGAKLLIPGCFVSSAPVASGEWPVIGHEDIDPATVEFPAGLGTEGPEPHFYRGEVILPISLDFHEVMRMNVFPTKLASSEMPKLCENYLSGKVSAMPNLANTDLRFSTYRDGVYRALGEDPTQPYSSFLARYGFDLGRFY
jgi:hypothetical protein